MESSGAGERPAERHAAAEAAPGHGAGGVDLDTRLTGALERVGHAIRVALWQQAKEHGLSPVQVQLLQRLSTDPPERRRVGQLAAELDVTQPTISDAVAALRRKALVTSSPSPGDARVQLLDLTDRGRDIARASAAWADDVGAELARIGTPVKVDALGLLLDVIRGLHERGVLSVARTCTTCRFFRRSGDEGPGAVHRCALLDAPLPPSDLRVDCLEHEPVAA
ncbi:MarR family winged helix-turn-helix transcriptional regulator [Patulibacter minatonensis]|uniref:MarR family winged helix-turn-helix transcriptional regulator n=1 Tax=Patulibacter minatonensis TaxID=298163 RepID=UPI0004B89724|nr:MarR family winged helix-turn-helix transcriptional regulator [Patulibacter minatonensis]